MKRPADWKGFLSNDDNKEVLAEVILDVWSEDSFAEKLKDRKVCLSRYFVSDFIFICQVFVIAGNSAYELTSKDSLTVDKTEMCELKSNQEETDTRVVLYSIFGSKQG